MSNCGFIKIPRTLLQDPLWKSLPYTYRHVYLTILENMCFQEQTFDDFGVLFHLKPGQLLISERRLTQLCNEIDIDRRVVQRALEKFRTIGFSIQTRANKKTIITISRKDILENIENSVQLSVQTSGQLSRQEKTTQDASKNTISKPSEPNFGPTFGPNFGLNSGQTRAINKKEENEKKISNYMSDSIEIGLSTFLFSRITLFLPSFKPPNFQVWAKIFDLMIRLDKRSQENIRQYIAWCTQDGCWWQGKILSPDKLRKHWDMITTQITPLNHKSSPGTPTKANPNGEIFKAKNVLSIRKTNEN